MIPETIKLNITQHHIDAGIRCDSQMCPVAEATMDALEGMLIEPRVIASYHVVDVFYSVKEGGNKRGVYAVPAELTEQMVSYDNEQGFIPGTYEIKLK